jgi:hypothetical protein
MHPGSLASALADADAVELAGTLHALLGEPAVKQGEGWKLGIDFGTWGGGGKDKSAAAALLRALPKGKQKGTALALLKGCPPGTAGAILNDFVGEEIAAMLANASADTHAKLLAELTREDPDKAAAFLAALSPEKAGAALSLVVAGANDGTGAFGLSEAEQFSLFGKAPVSALENVQPPTALGTMCASALTPSQAAEVLGKLSPSAAAAALEGMSGEEVRQVLEASAAASSAAGRPIADTPLVAAMVPYMHSLDAAGAAAMIESMPPDMAVGVMMNTPEVSNSHPPHSTSLIAHTRLTFLILQSGPVFRDFGANKKQRAQGTRGEPSEPARPVLRRRVPHPWFELARTAN